MGKIVDLTGKRFGRLLVLERSPNRNGRTMWRCRCDCGNEKDIEAYSLKVGHTKSCGCYKIDNQMKDLAGERFGRLTAINPLYREKGYWIWLCKCDCGNNVHVKGTSLTYGTTKSCGCLQRDSVIQKATSHGLAYHPLYRIYHRMIQRCENKKISEYKDYGGRGIKICPEWREDFKNFYDWSMQNGYVFEKGENGVNILSIDRINNDGDYEPSNCRWTTVEVQNSNKRGLRLLTLNNETHTATEWGKILGIPRRVINNRLHRGWSVERTLKTPVKSPQTKKGDNK